MPGERGGLALAAQDLGVLERVVADLDVVLRLTHEKHAGQSAQEESLDPAGHRVSGGRAEVNVEHNYGEENGERDQNHGEQEVLADERHHQGRGRNELGQEQEEHGEREENVDAESDLLAAVAGQVEREHGEEADAHAGYDQVDRVEKGLAAERDVEGDVRIGLRAARIGLDVALGRHGHDVPFNGAVIVAQVYTDEYLVALVGLLVDVHQVHLEAVVGPAAEFHGAKN